MTSIGLAKNHDELVALLAPYGLEKPAPPKPPPQRFSQDK